MIEISLDWPLERGRDLFAFITSGSRGWAAHYSTEGAKFIRVQNLRRGRIDLDLDDVQHVQPPQGVEGTRTRLCPGDIVISITADLGRVGLVSADIGEAYVSQHVALARPKDPTLSAYLAWYISGANAQEQLGLFDRGATRSGLGLKDIAALQIPLPPPSERSRIVTQIEVQLSRVNAISKNLSVAVKLGDRYLDSELQKTLSGGECFSEDGLPRPRLGTDDMAGSWLFDCIPENWRWLPFNDVFEDSTSSRMKIALRDYAASGEYPVIDQGEKDVGGWSNDSSLVYQGTFPVIIFGDHTRSVKFVTRPFIQGADGVKVLSPKVARVIPRFAYWLLRGIQLPDKGYARHFRFVRNSSFPIPPLPEQRRLVEQLEEASAAAKTVVSEINSAQRLTFGLSQAVLDRAFARAESTP